MSNRIQNLLTQFLEYLKIKKNRSPLTIRNYNFYLQRFLAFAKIIEPKEVTLEKIQDYQRYLNQLPIKGKRLSSATKNCHLIALRGWLKYLTRQKNLIILAPKIKLAKVKPRSHHLTVLATEKILAAPLKSTALPIVKLRDKAILELICGVGLKVSQVVGLARASFNPQKNKILFNKGKEIILPNQASYWLKQYLAKRLDDEPALFVSYDRGAGSRMKDYRRGMNNLTSRSVQRLAEKYGKLAGLSKLKVTPEILRKVDFLNK